MKPKIKREDGKMKKIENIAVIGIGKLGLGIAACLAQKYKVIALDIDKRKVEQINKGINPIEETGLTELINKYHGNLRATDKYEEAVINSQVTFVVVATPSDVDGSFSNKQLEECLRGIAVPLKKLNRFHLVVITSTVMPGTTEYMGKSILEKMTGKRCSKDFGIAYNPAFIALGSVIHDFLNPDFVLIGESNKKDGDILEAIYKSICENDPTFARISPINAEIAKISLNCYVTMKISYANSLAAICERIPGANSDAVANAIGLDSRIGRKYLKGGLGFGGPCFPRDNVAFASMARKMGIKAKLSEMVDEVNNDQAIRIVEIVHKKVPQKGAKISVLGLSYKPNTPIIEDSQSISIVEFLKKHGYKLSVWDPMALKNAQMVLGNEVEYESEIEKCLRNSEMCIITTHWEELNNMDMQIFKKIMKKPIVLDCWRVIEKNNLKDIEYLAIGKG